MTAPIDYDGVAAKYARYRRVHREVLRCLTTGLHSESKVLEVGCGTGSFIGAVCEAVGCPCWGIDPSVEMLAQAMGRFG